MRFNCSKNTSVLTIAETPGFARRGGVINFTLEDSKVRFEVNVDAAQQVGLNISSRLLSLAKIVQTDVEVMAMNIRNLSIKQKLTVMAMLTSSIAVILSSASFLIYDLVSFRQLLSQDLTTQAQIIAYNSAAAHGVQR